MQKQCMICKTLELKEESALSEQTTSLSSRLSCGFFLHVPSNCFNDQGLEFEANFHSSSNICCGKFL